MSNEKAQDDYKNLLDLLAVLTEATGRLAEMEIRANDHLLEYIDEVRKEYAQAQEAVTKSEAAIKALVALHPEWFSDKKTIKTPYGSVLSKLVSKLEVPNEEASILLIEAAQDLENALFIRVQKALNIEALEALADVDLKRLRIKRVKDESISIKPAKTDLGKAVAAKPEEKKAA